MTEKPADEAWLPWSEELEAARVALCHFWLKIADDHNEGAVRFPELGRRAIETEQALTILGEIARHATPSPAITSAVAAEREKLREALLPAYLGLSVLRTILKKEGLAIGVATTDDALIRLEEIEPALPGLSAMRPTAPVLRSRGQAEGEDSEIIRRNAARIARDYQP